MRSPFTIFAALSLSFVLIPSVGAAQVQWPAKLGAWALVDSAETPAGPDTAEPNPQGVMKESGLVGASSRTYRAGTRVLPLTLYTFHDSTGAYEAYTALQGMASFMNTNNAVVVRSNVVLWIRGVSDPAAKDLNELLAWEQSVSDGVASPPVASYLPNNRDLDTRSRQYALGPVGFREAAKTVGRAVAGELADAAGFKSGAEAMFANYKSGKQEATLLLIEYPTPQLAELHLRHLQRGLHDAKMSTSSIERKGSLLSIVLGTSSPEYAEKLRGAVNYETQVTWNEPSSTATDPPITSTLVKIIVATGVFMMVTLVLGIAFGGVRIITKRLFPGKVFDRPAQMEVLQLGLSGKPIDPRDMY